MAKAAAVAVAILVMLGPPTARAQLKELPVTPVTDAMLEKPDPQDWLMWRRTLDSWGYSPLTQIDGTNVGQLQLVWARGLEPGPQEGTPLVHDGVMYFPNPRDVIQALDAATGDLIWEHRRPQPPDIDKYINAPFINRNLAIHGHLIIDTSADGYLYALDARTGKEVWSTHVLDYKTGIHQTSGPIVAKGKVFSGRGCDPIPGANPDPCVIVAHDAATGRELWRTRTIPKPGEPGNESWGDVPFSERKHVGAWMPPSYDPKLNLLYFGTSVTSPAPKFLLGGNDKKHLYHNSTLALDANTGKIVWYYQHVVDHWDHDHTFERILLDTEVTPAKDSVAWINPRIKPGQKHEVLTGIPGKTGIVYTLDRRTGEFLWARPTVQQNVVANIDGRTGAVMVDAKALFSRMGDAATVCPSIHGGKNWPAGAYSPLTGAMYFPLQNICSQYTSITSSRHDPSNYGLRVANQIAPGTQNVGTIHAISVSTGEIKWKHEQRAATLSLLTTGGGLLFGGDVAGRFRAFDQRNGDILWETNLGSQVTGFPVTYSVRGKQYVAVSVGRAVATSAYALLTPELRTSENNSLFIFALPDNWAAAIRTTRAIQSSVGTPTSVTSGAPAPQCRRTNEESSPASGGTPDHSFTAAQSAQGKQIYMAQQCALCHGESMRGSAGVPALADPGFRLAWDGRPLSALFDCMKNTMPPGRSGALSDQEYVQLLAAILHANGFSPSETAQLSASPERLKDIAFRQAPPAAGARP